MGIFYFKNASFFAESYTESLAREIVWIFQTIWWDKVNPMFWTLWHGKLRACGICVLESCCSTGNSKIYSQRRQVQSGIDWKNWYINIWPKSWICWDEWADSPKNILNALDDDCIGSIFEQISNIRDFHSISNVCIYDLIKSPEIFSHPKSTVGASILGNTN